MVWTADQKEVDWPYSDTPMSTVPSEQLKRMLSSHILTRVLAHGECTGRQIDVLYRGEAINEIGRKRRRNGQRIIAMRLEVYCANVSEKNLNKVFGNRDLKYDRKATIEALLVKA